MFFAANSDRIQAHQRPAIESNYGCLGSCGQHRQLIELVGHADDQEADPVALGLARAAEVKRYFVARGFLETRLRLRSDGNKRPIRPGRTERDRSHNRRVEFVVLDAPPTCERSVRGQGQ